MPFRLLSILVVLFALATGPVEAQQQSPIVVEGILMIGEFLGPPNYGENPRTDKIERSYFLQLPAPLPTQLAKKGVKGIELGETSDRDYFIQLVILEEKIDQIAKLVGKKVRASGSAFRAQTGHHHTGTLVQATSISEIKSWGW